MGEQVVGDRVPNTCAESSGVLDCRPKYRWHQNPAYTLLNSLRQVLDIEVAYLIDTYATACEDRPVIVSWDGNLVETWDG